MRAFGFVACCATIALWASVSPSDSRAEEFASARPAEALCRCVTESGPIVAQIKLVLNEPLREAGLEFSEEPLENVVHFLQDEYKIPIHLDISALEHAGLTSDEPSSCNLRSISLKSALRLLLKQHGLTYAIRHEVLLITTPEEAEAELTTCVYDVRDLMRKRREDGDLQALTDAILACIAFETWAAHGGGKAEIKPLRSGLLVVSQTREVHDEIGDLLAAMRSTLAVPTSAPQEVEAGMSDDPFGGDGREGSGYGQGYGEASVGRGFGGEMGAEPASSADNPFD